MAPKAGFFKMMYKTPEDQGHSVSYMVSANHFQNVDWITKRSANIRRNVGRAIASLFI